MKGASRAKNKLARWMAMEMNVYIYGSNKCNTHFTISKANNCRMWMKRREASAHLNILACKARNIPRSSFSKHYTYTHESRVRGGLGRTAAQCRLCMTQFVKLNSVCVILWMMSQLERRGEKW